MKRLAFGRRCRTRCGAGDLVGGATPDVKPYKTIVTASHFSGFWGVDLGLEMNGFHCWEIKHFHSWTHVLDRGGEAKPSLETSEEIEEIEALAKLSDPNI